MNVSALQASLSLPVPKIPSIATAVEYESRDYDYTLLMESPETTRCVTTA